MGRVYIQKHKQRKKRKKWRSSKKKKVTENKNKKSLIIWNISKMNIKKEKTIAKQWSASEVESDKWSMWTT